MKSLKFKVGDYVGYYLVNNKAMFYGEIIKAERVKGLKPYTIKADDGSEKYAREEFLKHVLKEPYSKSDVDIDAVISSPIWN
jgi:hypothetical protein